MLRAIDVANFFINLFGQDEDNDLTNMKINKLLYYAQGHSYERLNRALFNDAIEAWQNGPVVNGVYQNLKDYGKQPVSFPIGSYNSDNYSDDEIELLLDIAREYGKYSAGKLRNMTHEQGTPWQTNYDGSFHKPIPSEEIAAYFEGKNPLQKFNPDVEIIGYSKDGHLVLPREELDDWDY